MAITQDLETIVQMACNNYGHGVEYVKLIDTPDDPYFHFILIFRQKIGPGKCPQYSYHMGNVNQNMTETAWIEDVHRCITRGFEGQFNV